MVKNLFTALILIVSFQIIHAQPIVLSSGWKFSKGDDMQRAKPNFDDSKWQPIEVGRTWEEQGNSNYDGYGWYRISFILPSLMKQKSFQKDSIKFLLGKIDDHDEVYLNGMLIGKNAGMDFETGNKNNSARYTAFDKLRNYKIPVNHPAIVWDGKNVLAVRVFDQLGDGGMVSGQCSVSMVDVLDMIDLDIDSYPYTFTKNKNWNKIVVLKATNTPLTFSGKLNIQIIDYENSKTLADITSVVTFHNSKPCIFEAGIPAFENASISYTFVHDASGNILKKTAELPFLLTPTESNLPKINGARIYACRPGNPFLYKIPVSGTKPITYKISGLPAGLSLNENTGIITGTVKTKGKFTTTITATNLHGTDSKPFTISIGDTISLTPPMGWNSWNCWGLAVSDEKVRSSAQAIIDKGLIDYGWSYVNIDDGWEADRDANGNIMPNEKFPDMKSLGDFLHQNGLKFGIYSSPGPKTCGGYTGSYGFEQKDVNTYVSWGVDYLKYDWCTYSEKVPEVAKAFQWTDYRLSEKNKKYLPELKKPYALMQKYLTSAPRDIVYSICQYGWGDVWTWGHEVNGQLWRTTGDIEDNWSSLYRIGFGQYEFYPYAKPGRWNDPDMLIVGIVGWGPKLHPTNLSINEQYTHISLWAMLSAPLLIGCDLAQLDDFTLNLLKNSEVIDINQDILGKQARRVVFNSNYEIYVKQLNDGSKAVAVFNISTSPKDIELNWSQLGLSSNMTLRDVWRQSDIGRASSNTVFKIPSHGCRLFRVY